MKNKHVIVVSVDAMVFEDLEYARELPHFKKLLEGGSLIERVTTIYPSLTHPVHATLLTGAPAGVTGVIRNEILTPGKLKGLPWYNLLSDIKCDTILHAAKRAGLTTACCTWPLTAKGEEVIDYLVPGILNVYSDGREHEMSKVYREYGATECLMDIIEEGMRLFGVKDVHPSIDAFQIYCAAEIIKRHKPNLLFTHPGFVDNARHSTGLFSDRVNYSVRETDKWLGQLMDAVKEAGIEDSTDFVILSDHGQLGIVRTISPNVFFKRAGLIRTDADGNITEWDAYSASGGLSAHVYLSRPDDKELYNKVYAMLCEMADEKLYGFEKVFTTEEVKEKYGLDGDFSFVLETDGYTSFASNHEGCAVQEIDTSDYRTGNATHGHLPEKGPQPPFIVCGPSFKKGVVIERGSILNHAPTIAKALGLTLKDSVGIPIDEILA